MRHIRIKLINVIAFLVAFSSGCKLTKAASSVKDDYDDEEFDAPATTQPAPNTQQQVSNPLYYPGEGDPSQVNRDGTVMTAEQRTDYQTTTFLSSFGRDGGAAETFMNTVKDVANGRLLYPPTLNELRNEEEALRRQYSALSEDQRERLSQYVNQLSSDRGQFIYPNTVTGILNRTVERGISGSAVPIQGGHP